MKGSGRYHRDQVAARRGRIARFAESLAEGATVVEAARREGLTISTGQDYMSRIRKELGWQAV